MSISGAFVRVPAGAFASHALIELEASQPGSRRMLRCKAMVVRATPDGIGILFDELRPEGLAPLFADPRHPVRVRTGSTRAVIPDAASSAHA